MQIPIEQIESFLYNDEEIRKKIIRDFGLDKIDGDSGVRKYVISCPSDLSNALVDVLEQEAVAAPEKKIHDTSEIFEAAVLAIASSANNWTVVQKNIPEIRIALRDFDASAVHKKGVANTIDSLPKLIGGQSPADNVKYILDWAEKLHDNPEFFTTAIERTFNDISIRLDDLCNGLVHRKGIKLPIATLCLAGIFSDPAKSWTIKGVPKLRGMGVPIACEFMRNLKWNCFKPDRHIVWAVEIFDHQMRRAAWHKEALEVCDQIYDIVGKRNKDLKKNIEAALLCIYATPEGYGGTRETVDTSYSRADNLLWAYIKYSREFHEDTLMKVGFRTLSGQSCVKDPIPFWPQL